MNGDIDFEKVIEMEFHNVNRYFYIVDYLSSHC